MKKNNIIALLIFLFLCFNSIYAFESKPLFEDNGYMGHISIHKMYANVSVLNDYNVELTYLLKNKANTSKSIQISFDNVENNMQKNKVLLNSREIFFNSNNELDVNFSAFESKELVIKYNKTILDNVFINFHPIILFNDLKNKRKIDDIQINFIFNNNQIELVNSNLKHKITKANNFDINFFDTNNYFNGLFFQIKHLGVNSSIAKINRLLFILNSNANNQEPLNPFESILNKQKKQKESSNWWMIIIITLTLICITVLIYYVYKKNKRETFYN